MIYFSLFNLLICMNSEFLLMINPPKLPPAPKPSLRMARPALKQTAKNGGMPAATMPVTAVLLPVTTAAAGVVTVKAAVVTTTVVSTAAAATTTAATTLAVSAPAAATVTTTAAVLDATKPN